MGTSLVNPLILSLRCQQQLQQQQQQKQLTGMFRQLPAAAVHKQSIEETACGKGLNVQSV